MLPVAHTLLLSRQNADGGWGFYEGGASWLEPTAYAALALHGTGSAARAMMWLSGLQAQSGAWLAGASTGQESWATALILILKCARREHDDAWRRGVAWLVQRRSRTLPAPGRIERLLHREPVVDHDQTLAGWPWTAGTAGWIEPTAHAVRALELSEPHTRMQGLRERIEEGVRLILDRQCRDSGWNYGNKRVLGEDLDSFPECTALALIGLCGRKGPQVGRGLECALGHWRRAPRGLAQALLRIALRMHGVPFDDRPVAVNHRTETTVLALSLIGEPEGTWRLWKGEAG